MKTSWLYYAKIILCCSVAQLYLTLCDPMDCSMARLPYSSPSPGVCSNLGSLSQWCYLTISSASPFSSSPQSSPASGSFPMNWFFTSGAQSIGAATSASFLTMNNQGWFSVRLTGLISLQSKGLPRVFFSTIVQKHQLFGTQPSLWCNYHICTWPLEKPELRL